MFGSVSCKAGRRISPDIRSIAFHLSSVFLVIFCTVTQTILLKNYKSESLNYEPSSLYNIEVELYRCFLFYNEFHLPQIADRCRCLKRVLKPV